MKAIMMSIKPEWVVKILNGEKTIEIRKKFPKYYVGWVYIYCTKWNKNECLIPDLQPDKVYHPLTEKLHRGVYSIVEENAIWNDCKKYILNGKVVARFWCDNVEEIYPLWLNWHYKEGSFCNMAATDYRQKDFWEELAKKSCLSFEELLDYLNLEKNEGYAWHIDKLDVFHEPRELSSFLVKSHKVSGVDREGKEKTFTILKPIVRAPQSWCYIEIGE